MAVPVFSTGEVLTAAAMNAVGMWRVTGCTVTSAGGTAATASNGIITMGAGNTRVNIANAFSANFDNYLITVNSLTGSTTGAALYFGCLTTAGAVNASNWVGNTVYVVTGTTGAFQNAADTNSASVGAGGIYQDGAGATNFTVNAPFLTQRTSLNYNGADEDYFRVGAAVLKNATSYSGFFLEPNAGTMSSGVVRVYGFNK